MVFKQPKVLAHGGIEITKSLMAPGFIKNGATIGNTLLKTRIGKVTS